MRVSQLSDKLEGCLDGIDALVVVQDHETGRIFEIKDVLLEVHEDGDGSTTCFIQVEEA